MFSCCEMHFNLKTSCFSVFVKFSLSIYLFKCSKCILFPEYCKWYWITHENIDINSTYWFYCTWTSTEKFNYLRIMHSALHIGYGVDIIRICTRILPLPHSHHHLSLGLLVTIFSIEMRQCLIEVIICISLIISDIELFFFIILLVICTLKKNGYSTPLKNWGTGFILENCMSSLCDLSIIILLDIQCANIFSSSVGFSFCSLLS